MASNKLFKPEFRTRDGKTVSFGANYTHDTKAKRRAGLTKAGKKSSAGTRSASLRRPGRWARWTAAGASAVALGGVYAVNELGPVGGSLVIGGSLYGGYKTVRWVAGEWAYFAIKRRQITAGQQEVHDEPALDDIIASAPGTKVNYPGGRR